MSEVSAVESPGRQQAEIADVMSRHDPAFCWEDIEIGETLRSGGYVVTEDEIMAFARRYDPLPIHVDRAAAAAGPFGVITAPGSLILALRQRLMNDFAFPGGVIVCAGFDEVRFLAPLRAGESCCVDIRFVEKRPSASRRDRGIVMLAATLLADDRPILTLNDTVLMRRRAAAA